jgi:hypothetical protein
VGFLTLEENLAPSAQFIHLTPAYADRD